MVAVLTGFFGADKLFLAEDIVQDTLMTAMSNWTYNGIPEKPVAWLYTVAKNKALNTIKREGYKRTYIADALREAKEKDISQDITEDFFTESRIIDDQLRMMFMCCHISISKDSQIALILKTLCGFNSNEIAKCFLTNTENINKRLVRARKKIREANIPFEVPALDQLDSKVDTVLEAIYLLFNEGYSASTGVEIIREDLCKEAIRLTKILIDHSYINDKSRVYALVALMQLNISRFNARKDKKGNIITLDKQDRSLWDFHIMEQGFSNLKRSTKGKYISKYHILATISAYHCSAKDFNSTDWDSILILYDKLITIDSSPIVLLNRAIVISETGNIKKALRELEIIKNEKVLVSNHLFYAAKAEFYQQLKEYSKAKNTLKKAIELAPLSVEKKMLENRLNILQTLK